MLDTVANRLLPHEHSQPIPCDLFCARKISIVGSTHTNPARKSGQSLIEHSYKADSDLSPAGWEYAERLREFVTERRAAALEQRGYDPSDRRLVVRPRFLSPGMVPNTMQIWTSTRRRAHHTAWPFQPVPPSMSTMSLDSSPPTVPTGTPTSKLNVKVIEKTQMSEINPGVWDGLTPDQAKRFYPEEWARFVKDPYAFRAPRAESYHDLSGKSPSNVFETHHHMSLQCVWNPCSSSWSEKRKICSSSGTRP